MGLGDTALTKGTPFTGTMEEQQGALGPAINCVSTRSDRSMAHLIAFQKQPTSSDPGGVSKDLNQDLDSVNERIQQGALTSEESCVSLRSDWSMEHRNDFKSNTQSLEVRSDIGLNQTKSLSKPRMSSLGSDQHRSEFSHHKSHSHIMKELKVTIEAFLESELNHLDRILSEEMYTDPEESMSKDEDEDTKSSREAVLHLSTHFLRKMNQNNLAQCLLSRTKAVKCISKLKSKLKRTYKSVFEGVSKAGHQTDLSQIYTDLWITEGNNAGVDIEHEVHQIQTDARKHRYKTVKCQEMFGNSPCGGQLVRTMLTKGVAGIGKTLCVQKVVLDWAESKAHHNIRFMLPFSFRELNVLKDRSFSLVGFVHHFFVEIKEAEVCSFDDIRVVFIFDGLDESRLKLNFENCQSLTDITESAPLDVLLVNLIRGKLLPVAQLWITTRPAAANQIPAECISMVTEVRGFTDPQKEQYFRKRFEDEQATVIINHMKTNRSLHNMCYIPIFCWILFTVLKHVMEAGAMSQLPHTLTQMYIHLLVVHTKVKGRKYDGRSEMDSPWTPETKKMVQSLGKLAFEQLQRGNLIFYESDLSQCGLDAAAASVCSGVFTQVFREEHRLSGCLLTEKGFGLLGGALDSCQLRELDLRYNHPGDSGIHMLSAAREQPACSLTTLRTEHGGLYRLSPGPKKYACELTMDLNTAHRGLQCFENNCVIDGDVPDQEGADSFEFWHQVMCSEGLMGRCYWEVKWRGLVSIAVTYRGIQKKGKTCASKLGGNCLSWALDCSHWYYSAWHNNIMEKRVPSSHRWSRYHEGAECTVVVYLDWEEGVLSFFRVLPSGLELIHTFHTAFNEPLIPAFRLRSEYTLDTCNSVTVCPVQT